MENFMISINEQTANVRERFFPFTLLFIGLQLIMECETELIFLQCYIRANVMLSGTGANEHTWKPNVYVNKQMLYICTVFFYYNKYESLPAAGLKYFIKSLAAYFADVFYVM